MLGCLVKGFIKEGKETCAVDRVCFVRVAFQATLGNNSEEYQSVLDRDSY